MKLQIYTDDGYKQVELEHVEADIDVVALIDMLYTKKILSAYDVNQLLPVGFEVVEADPSYVGG